MNLRCIRNLTTIFLMVVAGMLHAQRSETLLEKNWKFLKGDPLEAQSYDFDDSAWETVRVPHDWAIYGPFDTHNDLQDVAITQNFETKSSVKSGRTGALPYMGVGWYRTEFDTPTDKEVTLLFDGAMSEARVYVNGKEACFWAYGYNAFHCNVTSLLRTDRQPNILAVRLENHPQSSRWYPGAGLYRNVHLITTEKIHVPVWGTYITTPRVGNDFAAVKLRTALSNADGKAICIETSLIAPNGKTVAQKTDEATIIHGQPLEQNFIVSQPQLWTPEGPSLYRAVSKIYANGKLIDTYSTPFGIRNIEFVAEKGFYLNGQHRKFRGVCNHHDLGPLGAAVNKAALRHQLRMLKEMGCDAIRTSHNMPAPELVHLCDELGLMVMVEAFDEWDEPKCANGYHRFFNEWAERDMVNMIHHFRNHPSVVMWSIGNEMPTQCRPDGYKVAHFLQNICHREDPTRPVTCGMDQIDCILNNGFGAVVDIPGFNYRTHRYVEGYQKLPQNLLLGSETASTVSSRGVYKFPVEERDGARYDDFQSSSYDLEAGGWCNRPDIDFALAEDNEWTLGQFVWTGFDYLGEPFPYDTEGFPNHSSLFGIIDLASLPKDRYYLYRSQWNQNEPTLHILPHWTWTGRKGKITPVFVYTSYPEAELFINGKSMGRQKKNNSTLKNRFRIMWTDVVYEPGELRVVAYDNEGNKAAEKTIHTAGKPYQLELNSYRTKLSADGKDLAYVTVKVVDKDGNLCPTDNRLIHFSVKGAGTYRAGANGDPTCFDAFHLPRMHAFNGMMTAIVQAAEQPGSVQLTASAKGMKSATIRFQVQ